MPDDRFYKQTTLPSALEETAPTVPDMVGPYKIETLLGRGGMSLTYLGMDPVSREMRAIKVLSPKFVDHPEMTDHFLWEAKIVGMATHPNIVKLYDHGKWEGGLFIAMEFIRGISLRQFIMQQSFSLRKSIDIVLQVAYALCHLHTHGVIHRDLKPENILIAEDGEIKVIDFGIAQLHGEEKRPKISGQIVGTPSYMSPEQKENPENVSFASDIYALGIITYELILGKLSYGVINPSLLPTGLQPIVGKALAISKEERYQDIVDFITDLSTYYKSPVREEERTAPDQMMETFEMLKKGVEKLSPVGLPEWSQVDMGLSEETKMGAFGACHLFFRLANGTLVVMQAQTQSRGIESAVNIGAFTGMVQTLIAPYLKDPNQALMVEDFTSDLNALILENDLKEIFYFSLLKMIPINDSVVYLDCGRGPMLHLSAGGKTPRFVSSENPPLGEDATSTYSQTEDAWEEGDLLLFHSLPDDVMAESLPLGQTLAKTLGENSLLSTTRLASLMLEQTLGEHKKSPLLYPPMFLTVQRIA